MRTNGYWATPWPETRRFLPARIMWKRPGESSIRRCRRTLRYMCTSQAHGGRTKSLNEFRPSEDGITRRQTRRARTARSRLRNMSFLLAKETTWNVIPLGIVNRLLGYCHPRRRLFLSRLSMTDFQSPIPNGLAPGAHLRRRGDTFQIHVKEGKC